MRLAPICLLLVFLSPLQADYETGVAAYQRGDFATAYQEWLTVAESPPESVPPPVMAETSYALGMLFWLGQGVIQDSPTAASWLLRAAELGHPGAQTKLGYLYGSGQGVRQSDFEALKWTQMAANQGDVDAQYNLGVFYRDGSGGIGKNEELALQWFREAASNGDQISADVVANYESYGWPGTPDMAPASQPAAAIAADVGVDPSSEPEGQPASEPAAAIAQDVGVDSSIDTVSQPESTATEPIALATTVISSPSALAGENAAAAVGEEETGAAIRNESWISQRPPQNFTIQVIALLSTENLLKFVEKNPESGPFAIYQQRWKGKPLYVLLQGDYADIEQARAAAAEFPPGLQNREELWIRKFAMVQGLLRSE